MEFHSIIACFGQSEESVTMTMTLNDFPMRIPMIILSECDTLTTLKFCKLYYFLKTKKKLLN